MEVFTGIVSHVRHTASVHGDSGGVGTSQGVSFRIDSRSVEMWSPTTPQIETGDEVTVVGDLSDGVLRGRAYRNHNSGATGRREKWAVVRDTALFCVSGGVVGTLLLVSILGPIGLLLIPICYGWWAVLAWGELKTRRALRLARASRPAPRLARPVRMARPVRCSN